MTAPTPAPWLVVAAGNASRGDDALGPMMAARLRERWADMAEVEIREGFQLQIEDVLALDGRLGVLFVDAAVRARTGIAGAESPDVAIRPLEPAAPDAATAFSHALSPAVLLALYRRVLGHAAPPAWLLALPGSSFELGAPLSAPAGCHLEQGLDAALDWLRERRAWAPAPRRAA